MTFKVKEKIRKKERKKICLTGIPVIKSDAPCKSGSFNADTSKAINLDRITCSVI